MRFDCCLWWWFSPSLHFIFRGAVAVQYSDTVADVSHVPQLILTTSHLDATCFVFRTPLIAQVHYGIADSRGNTTE